MKSITTRKRFHAPTTVALVLAAASLAACGASDEEEVRTAVKEFQSKMRQQDSSGACELMSARARAQTTTLLTTFTGGPGGRSCESILKKTETEDPPDASDLAKATITLRDDRALVRYRGTFNEPMGLKKIDGEWRVDNLLNPTLDELPRRSEPGLTKGSDEQQVIATLAALGSALEKKDLGRACDLYSDAGEAQILLGGALTSFGDPKASETSSFTCEKALGKLAELADGPTDLAPSARQLDDARVTIRKDRATVKVAGEEPTAMIHVDGRWLVDVDQSSDSDSDTIEVDEPPTAAELKRCWTRAGAKIASDAGDLRFAKARAVDAMGVSEARVSLKGGDWRVFYSLVNGEDPGYEKVLAKPSIAGAVAFIRDASAHADVVNKARACD